jgi:tRNA threonylcarbamoyladenosine biosynthesis protein TsaE
MVIDIKTVADLQAWGKEFSSTLSEKDVIFLQGPLGAGKTTLVTAIAVAYGVPEDQVSSPTFALHNHMLTADGQSVHHLDGYRIETPKEYEQIGLEMLPQGLTFVEWPEKCRLLKPTFEIKITVNEDETRRLECHDA